MLIEHVTEVSRIEPEWPLLVIEFRVHAARDEALNRRYAALHERTVEALADLFASLYERAGDEPPLPPRRMAEVMLAVGTGTELEMAANPEALGGDLAAAVLTDVVTRKRPRPRSRR